MDNIDHPCQNDQTWDITIISMIEMMVVSLFHFCPEEDTLPEKKFFAIHSCESGRIGGIGEICSRYPGKFGTLRSLGKFEQCLQTSTTGDILRENAGHG